MKTAAKFLAIDLGAASGRMVTASWDGERFALEELHRFGNEGVSLNRGIHWDVLRLWTEIKIGLEKFASRYAGPPVSISVDTWGVDFALLDESGQLIGNPHHYRDPRTASIPEQVFAKVSREVVFRRTGIQSMPINTLFQLFSMVQTGDRRLDIADRLLMMPDLFHYWLSGEKGNEYTIASTSEMLDCRTRTWATDMIAQLRIPTHLLGPIVPPGTILGDLRLDLAHQCNLKDRVSVVAGASHDTASAVAAIPCLGAQSAYISSGTWSLMGIETDAPVTSASALSFALTNEGGVNGTIRLLKNITGLWLIQECVRSWSKSGRDYRWAEIIGLASAAAPLRSLVDPDADDFSCPVDMPEAIRNYCRRTRQPVPESDGALARCCLESLSLKYRVVLEGLEKASGRTLNDILVVGGGSQNTLLCQFTADACRRRVIAGPVEASALGNAMVQAVATGHLSSTAVGRKSIGASYQQTEYEPRTTEQWDGAYERFCKLLDLAGLSAARAG